MSDNGSCLNCGGHMIGDGYTMVLHCEFVDDIFDIEPDAPPIYCETLVNDYMKKNE